MSDQKAVAIVVGGGPAPGINGVISAATIEAINRGHKVYGIHSGFKRLAEGDLSCLMPLEIADVSRIGSEGGSILGTSRANPNKSPATLAKVVSLLRERNIGYLVSIGGDGTLSSARELSSLAGGELAVAHVPKTIDNDLPLPNDEVTFGFESARQQGSEIVETLMVDAKTTSRWYLTIAMGRKAGHLALGIGFSSGATLTIIPEEFADRVGKVSIEELANVIVGSILKRLVNNQPYGVVILAEGLAEVLDKSKIIELSEAERDSYGRIRYAEVDFGGIVKKVVKKRLKEFGISDLLVVDKNIGYELRCHPPVSFDREYSYQLGYGVVDYLLNGGRDSMIVRRGDNLLPVPFSELIDPKTNKTRIRMVDLNSVRYRVASKYMIRLKSSDFEDRGFIEKLVSLTNSSEEQLQGLL
jgi:ATP-dependent phosphofructokinase / diphosphate-dependent phosphofructokinase